MRLLSSSTLMRASQGSPFSSVQGGYIVVPPSQRKGRSYTVFRDGNPSEAPRWIYDEIYKGPPSRAPRAPRARAPATEPFPSGDVDLVELADAMQYVPNPDLDWDDWNAIGMALWAASRGSQQGYELFAAFSKKSKKYNAN
jgi:hypothetical protein